MFAEKFLNSLVIISEAATTSHLNTKLCRNMQVIFTTARQMPTLDNNMYKTVKSTACHPKMTFQNFKPYITCLLFKKKTSKTI